MFPSEKSGIIANQLIKKRYDLNYSNTKNTQKFFLVKHS
jgi:hypothetical protein